MRRRFGSLGDLGLVLVALAVLGAFWLFVRWLHG